MLRAVTSSSSPLQHALTKPNHYVCLFIQYRTYHNTKRRNVSELATVRLLPSAASPAIPSLPETTTCAPPPPLSRMPTPALLRSLLMNICMASPILRVPCMGVLKLAATSKLSLFDPDKNPVLATILYSTAYKQFCAGRNPTEVKQTIDSVKDTGFQGVVLCYGREIVLDKSDKTTQSIVKHSAQDLEDVRLWRQGLIQTLECIGSGDILAIKFTGAGRVALDALKNNQPMPEPVAEAMDTICHLAARKNSRLWLDAEQAMLQDTIDAWTIDLMRKHNTNGTALVSNTIQAYLKSAPDNLAKHLRLASQEGWTLGIKLVRGAYIESDPRELLHDTIEQTHLCFDTITHDLITQKMPPSLSSLPFPQTQLFIATHNAESVHKAQTTQQARLKTHKASEITPIEFGQLQGMADEISYDLVDQSTRLKGSEFTAERSAAPQAFKYLTWGSLKECLGYLHRRAVENRGAVQRTKHVAHALGTELFRRITT